MNNDEFTKLKSLVYKHYQNLSHGFKLSGAKKPLTYEENVILSYYMGVISYLNSKGLISSVEGLDPELIEEDSNPKEDDYL